MTKFAKTAGLVFAGVIVGLLLSAASSNRLGGVYNQVTNYFREGIKVGTSNQFEVTSAGAVTTSGALTTTGDATVSGGTLNLTTSNTATSTIIVGCIQTYATSTATPIKIQATTTAHAPTPVYGTCPNL